MVDAEVEDTKKNNIEEGNLEEDTEEQGAASTADNKDNENNKSNKQIEEMNDLPSDRLGMDFISCCAFVSFCIK